MSAFPKEQDTCSCPHLPVLEPHRQPAQPPLPEHFSSRQDFGVRPDMQSKGSFLPCGGCGQDRTRGTRQTSDAHRGAPGPAGNFSWRPGLGTSPKLCSGPFLLHHEVGERPRPQGWQEPERRAAPGTVSSASPDSCGVSSSAEGAEGRVKAE